MHDNTVCQLPPEVQAALEAAQASLAKMAAQPAPTNVAQLSRPPRLAKDLLVWGQIRLKPAGQALLEPEVTSVEFFETLLKNDCLADARRVLAHSLPKRRALWWATLTCWDLQRQSPCDDLENALQLAANFVISPIEEHRQATGNLARRLPANSLACCLSQAVYFSAGSISPPGHPHVAARPFVTGRLVGAAVYLAAVKRSAALYKQYLREYLRWGKAIAQGEMLWPSTEGPANNATRIDAYWKPAPAGLRATTPLSGANA